MRRLVYLALSCNTAPADMRPELLAVIAMTQYRLANEEQAKLKRLRETFDQPKWAQNEEARALLLEAEEVVEGVTPQTSN